MSAAQHTHAAVGHGGDSDASGAVAQATTAQAVAGGQVAMAPAAAHAVVFRWAVLDALWGKRGVGLLLAALAPTLLLLMAATLGDAPPLQRDELRAGAAVLVLGATVPPILGLVAIVTGSIVMRRPQEEGTLLYQLTRPQGRFGLGATRAAAAGVVTAGTGVVAVLAMGLALGQWDLLMAALPGVVAAGLAFGGLYGLLVSVHRYAFGAAALHLVAEMFVAHLPFDTRAFTLSWHAWSGMGSLAAEGVRNGVIPPVAGGSLLVPLAVAALGIALAGVLFQRWQFGLGVAEA